MKAFIAVVLFIGIGCAPSWAETGSPPLEPLFQGASQALGTPLDWTMAIAKVESNFHPWSLNIEGRGYTFDSKENALAKAREAWNEDRSFDSGLMQVNSWWLKKYGIPLEAALDPEANIYLGAWILGREIDRHGDLRSAVGAYHSPAPARASHYADQVREALKRGPRPVKGPARPSAKTQGAGSSGLSEKRRMLVTAEKSMTPSEATMKTGLATQESMKAAATRPDNSMKIQPKKEMKP